MSLSTYQLFCTIAETRNLTRAAELLNMTPSAASHAISSLEKSVGFELLNRNRQGVTLTDNGELLLQHFHAVLAEEIRLQEEISQIHGLQKGVVHMGVVDSICRTYLPDILLQFTHKYPQLEICVHQDDCYSIENMVLNGELELGFVSLPTSEQLSVITLMHDKLLCITPKSFVPENESYVTIEELRNQVLIQAKRGYDKCIASFFAENGLKCSPKHNIALESSAITMVASGMGCSILPESLLGENTEKYNVYPLENNLHRSIGLITSKNRRMSLAGARMIKMIRQIIK